MIFENLIKTLTENLAIVSPSVTLFGILISLFTTIRYFNKKVYFQINKERLEFVYFPLMTEINSYYGEFEGYNFYCFLSDKINDEKYKTLLGLIKINILYDELKECYSITNNLRKARSIYFKMTNCITREYNSIKRKLGYSSKASLHLRNTFFTWYIFFILSAGFSSIAQNDSSVIDILYFFLFLFFVSTFLLIIFLISYCYTNRSLFKRDGKQFLYQLKLLSNLLKEKQKEKKSTKSNSDTNN